MNQDQLWGFARTLLTMLGTALGTYLVSKQYLSADQLGTIKSNGAAILASLAPVIPIAVSLWGTWKSHSAKGKLTSVAAMPDVEAVKMAPTPTGATLAAAVPSAKVTS